MIMTDDEDERFFERVFIHSSEPNSGIKPKAGIPGDQ